MLLVTLLLALFHLPLVLFMGVLVCGIVENMVICNPCQRGLPVGPCDRYLENTSKRLAREVPSSNYFSVDAASNPIFVEVQTKHLSLCWSKSKQEASDREAWRWEHARARRCSRALETSSACRLHAAARAPI
jgi:hypothetical protein